MDHPTKNVPLVMKPNTYKKMNVRMLVIQASMKMKNLTLVNHVTQHVKNVQVEPVSTVLNVMKIPT
jgi:hypothetical protein